MGCSGSKAAPGTPAAPKAVNVEGDFKVTLERTDDAQTLGLSVMALPAEPNVLSIDGVKDEGLVPEFMKSNPDAKEQHVAVGDRIVAVNGVGGDLDKMKAEMKAKKIILAIQRNPAAPAAAAPAPASAEKKEEQAAPAATEQAEKKAETEAAPAADAAVAAAAPVEEKAPAATDAPAAEAAPAVEPAAKTEDATTEVAVQELQDSTVAEEAKEEKLCNMAMC